MLPASERAKKSSVFSRAYTARRTVASGCLTLYVLHRFKPKHQTNKRNNRDQSISAPESAIALNAGVQVKTPLRLLVGFAIAKKVLKSACKRNRCKRRVREAYRAVRSEPELLQQLESGASSWYALVFVINPSTLTVPFEEVKGSVRECLLKANKRFGRPQ